ncbi:pentapeptide repeat-containing protein [Trichormus variabilis ARAD]|nr:pentapeptide repeat-containing protein [Trichormus variabilis ARAD]MBC1258786.1 pentapeptide repeat-containing protein [Trichormus variabilis V5]MBC1266061.1 pentapeptide repeat-containing protein [Trichormus variabilis FSR]MBC1301290.1 pentapeptide repeat-containing protein [Trichormus variabilis N2B]MBC1309571.1 pentapeptide repeat-containing protein [Trichormus variabilis PNB]MBC1325129.1 pentapeptide repeat-containing protein [Trichormus variabilis 9RC]MBD2378431.1 pentapeptide repeat-
MMLTMIFNVYRTVAGKIQHNNLIENLIDRIVFSGQKKIACGERNSITQRLQEAIRDLHHNQTIETRLKAIYELKQIAHDYPKQHWLIMEVLSNFIHNCANNISSAQLTSSIDAEIQAALTVIAHRDTTQDPENQQLDLSHIDIAGANLSKANLENANLYRVNLAGANLLQANLCGAILTAANLSGANLAGANLSGSILSAANLVGANLTGANLAGANLYLANLQEVILHEAIFNGANLREAKFTTADTSNR